MELNSEQITAAALRLTSAERARIADALIASLDLEDMGWDADWLAEVERRERADDGIPPQPASEVFAEIRAALALRARSGTSTAL